jgi:hypothetical protein
VHSFSGNSLENVNVLLIFHSLYSGLDPASLFFEKAKPDVRLDPSDGIFVDVIHTDGRKYFGMNKYLVPLHMYRFPHWQW